MLKQKASAPFQHSLAQKLLAYGIISSLLMVSALALLPVFSQVRLTIELNGFWLGLWAGIYLLLTAFIARPLIQGRVKIFVSNSRLKRVGAHLAGLLGFAVLTSFATLGGLPMTLHYLTVKPGHHTVTLSHKLSSPSSRTCHPRLRIKEFTWLGKDHLCPSEELYQATAVGDRIVIKGQLSSLGITPEQFKKL